MARTFKPENIVAVNDRKETAESATAPATYHNIDEIIADYEEKYRRAPDEIRESTGIVLAMLYSEKMGFAKFTTL